MLITRDDIQRIGDEDTLLHFLEEKLNLPIPEGLTLEDITLKFSNFALGLRENMAEQVSDCQELSVSPGQPSGIFLIRFNGESDYSDVLRAVADGLDQHNRNPADLRFICMNEDFRPFAFAYFSDSELKDWQAAVLNILTWTQDNTHIHTSAEHKLSIDFFPNMSASQPVGATSPKALLAKLESIGVPLGKDNIYGGISLGHKKVFVIDRATCEHLSKDSKSAKIIKSFPNKPEKWRWESGNVIYIPSSKNRQHPWSGITTELEAEREFKKAYPAISRRMKDYKSKLKAANIKVEFYWEFPATPKYEKLKHPKIIFYANDTSMRAAYDPSCKFLYSSTLFIPTEDFSLLAILNSKLFNWYAQNKFSNPKIKQLSFTKKNMVKAPIASRTEKQKAELSGLVQHILDAPNSRKVSAIEREIDELVYKLYELTPAEIALIEEETSQ